MNNIENLKPFIEEYTDDFYESIEDIRKYLSQSNKLKRKSIELWIEI